MRRNAVFAALASVVFAGAGLAGTPAVIEMETEERLRPIVATFPPMSESEISQRCHGFFRAVEVRWQLARMMGFKQLDVFGFLTELPLNRLERVADASAASDYVTPYMREFGPLNPARTVRLGLFNSDRETCTAFLDGLG